MKPISLLLLILACAFVACEDSVILVDLAPPEETEDDPIDDPPDDPEPGNKGFVRVVDDTIFIVDRTGKWWNVTHAVEQYGFEPYGFQFGLGPHAIKPIDEPLFLCPQDEGYPGFDEGAVDSTPLVMGVAMNGHVRAYPLSIMSKHEVVNENFGQVHVAVAY